MDAHRTPAVCAGPRADGRSSCIVTGKTSATKKRCPGFSRNARLYMNAKVELDPFPRFICNRFSVPEQVFVAGYVQQTLVKSEGF